MVLATFVTPVVQVGREIRIELTTILGAGRVAQISQRMRYPAPLLPEQRPDDRELIELRKAEALLRSVRNGAVRR